MTPADISVIIPTLNEATSIAQCVQSAREAGASQIIVADGGSDDQTRLLATHAGATHVVRSLPGRGTQLNSGAALASQTWLLFLHSDNRLAPTALEQICVQAARDASLQWGAMRQRIEDARWIYRVLEWGNSLRVRVRGLPLGDQAMFVRRDVFNLLGGFPDLPLMEDVELSQKLRRIQWPHLLAGPVSVSARRWQRRGVLRQTALNLRLQTAHALGVSPVRLARWYR